MTCILQCCYKSDDLQSHPQNYGDMKLARVFLHGYLYLVAYQILPELWTPGVPEPGPFTKYLTCPTTRLLHPTNSFVCAVQLPTSLQVWQLSCYYFLQDGHAGQCFVHSVLNARAQLRRGKLAGDLRPEGVHQHLPRSCRVHSPRPACMRQLSGAGSSHRVPVLDLPSHSGICHFIQQRRNRWLILRHSCSKRQHSQEGQLRHAARSCC